MVKVISLGGSIVAPDNIDTEFLSEFTTVIKDYLASVPEAKLVFIIGGGAPARMFQNAYKGIADTYKAEEADWIGITATRLNAQLLHAVFSDYCNDPVVYDPTSVSQITSRILIAAGWKPGFSTDYDAVLIAERLSAQTVINLTNIPKVYTADPKKDPNAKPIDSISWKDFRILVGDEWVPGRNLPFDPVATKHAAGLGLRVISAAGKNITNLINLLYERPFEGTVIGPE